MDEESFRLNPNLHDTLALKGLLFEGYGHFLFEQKKFFPIFFNPYLHNNVVFFRFEDGEWYYNEALALGNRLFGSTHPKCLHMLHDFANGCIVNREFDRAVDVMQNLCARFGRIFLFFFFVNFMFFQF